MSKTRRYRMDIKIIDDLRGEDKLWFIIDRINKTCSTVDSKYYTLRGYLEYINDKNIIWILKSEFNKLIENSSYNFINDEEFPLGYDFKAVAIWLIFQGKLFYEKMDLSLLKEYFEANDITGGTISEYLCIANVFDESLNISQLASAGDLDVNTYYPTKKMIAYNDEYSSLLWNIIELSKMGARLNNSRQYSNLIRILNKHEKHVIEGLMKSWKGILYSYSSNNEFENLYISNGGIVECRSDVFYTDFNEWLVAQGEELYYDFIDRGRIAVIEYIEKNRISSDDYTYENMGYVWHEICDRKGIDY